MELPAKYDKDSSYFRSVGRNTINAGFEKKEDHLIDWSGGSFPLFSLSIVLRGQGVYVDSQKRQYNLAPGSIFFRIPKQPHQTTIAPDCRWLEFFVAFHFMDRNVERSDDIPKANGFVPLDEGRTGHLKFKDMPGQDDRWVYPMCRHLLGLSEHGPVREIELSLELLNACENFVHCLRTDEDETMLPGKGLAMIIKILENRKKTPSDRVCDQVRQLIQENLDSHRKIPDILKSLPLSYATLRKHFQRQAGCSIGQYQIQCRMEKAVHLLQLGRSVKEVSDRLGYSDPYFFSRQFHQQLGYPPSVLNKKSYTP